MNADTAFNSEEKWWRRTVTLLPLLWLLLFFFVPFLIVFKISFTDPMIAQPPYTPVFEHLADGGIRLQLTLDNYRVVFGERLYWLSYLNSVKIAFISTVLCLLMGYPMAYGIARSRGGMRSFLLLLVILPFWTSFLLRVYAWMGMLSTHGLINTLLLNLGLIDKPMAFMYNDYAVYLGIVYTYLPYMVLPLYASLEKLDPNLRAAAQDLGARPGAVFREITLPLSLPGIWAGSLLVFIPALGEFVIPTLLGGLDTLMIGRTLYDEFFINRDWPLASAVASVLLAILVVPIALLQRAQAVRTV